ncbi:MAG: DUF3426 domain-containing protein [Methylophilaceae bacterium]|jgi:predicted Zn finger-like uncharacterized protein|nr:DUF3426 domain-containing protein [Methylophilaceae bacterium]MDG1453607.1 DUF3426 domain-containing protein [Methylophilaceae bacterium]
MNYITACPNCNTQFLLNDELIKAYRGKVQCGNCEHVFNAKNRLTEVPDEITSADEYQASLEDAIVEVPEQTTIIESSIASNDSQDTLDKTAQIESIQAESVETESSPKQTDVDYFISPPALEVEAISQPTSQVDTPAEPVNIDAIFSNKRREKKKTSKHSFFISFINFLLFMAAVLLCAYFLRSEIARQFPPIKPLLERACVSLKCKIELAKNLDLITIGDSDMQEDDTYQSVIKFSSSIKNNANYPQAYPSLELTLTDNDDRPVIKKLITPKLYLVSKEKIKHGLDYNETATIKLSFHVDDPSVGSYRILLLY